MNLEAGIAARMMSGPQDGLLVQLDLPDGDQETTWTVGRSDECDIALTHDTQVSRTHARLHYVPSDETMGEGTNDLPFGLYLEDIGSRNGTTLETRRIRGERVALAPGQLFRVGRTWLTIEL
ncbi:FHA domain-containing protein [Chloroflexota bacterium]